MDMHIAQDAPLTGIDVDSLPPAEGEAVLRRQLAAAYRLVDYFGWTELIYGHLTARVPGEQAHFLINPFGLNYDEVTASNLVKIDLDGNNVGESKHPVNYAGFVIHSAVHMAHAGAPQGGDAHPHPRRHGGVRAEGRAAADLDGGHLLPRQARLSRLRGPQPRPRRARPAPEEPRRQPGDDAAQPRPADHRPHGARGLPAALSPGARLPDPARRGGGRHAQHHGRQSGRQVGRRPRPLRRDSDTGHGDLEFAALIRKLDKVDTSWRH